MTDPPRGVRDVRNNWVLLLAVALVSLGGAVVYLLAGENSVAIPGYFLAGAAAVAATGFWWFAEHPQALRAPAWAYTAVVVALVVGAFLAGTIPGSRSVGAWIAVGLGFVCYGALERSAVVTTAGGVAAAGGLAGIWATLPALGFWLELFTAVVFGTAAAILRLR
ncbi:hypothetical protein [Dietzia alimentaria]|uniref:hypothetical protein n=1 Tax=Dietzia alimentaria TaxID=665550 RepID=UPI001EE6814E|nr:hypothetical protein [Dietzia alimentaria]